LLLLLLLLLPLVGKLVSQMHSTNPLSNLYLSAARKQWRRWNDFVIRIKLLCKCTVFIYLNWDEEINLLFLKFQSVFLFASWLKNKSYIFCVRLYPLIHCGFKLIKYLINKEINSADDSMNKLALVFCSAFHNNKFKIILKILVFNHL